jgi:protein kinase C substrate 80K-H
LISADSSRARQALTDAESELEDLKSDKETAESDALEIFNIHNFGAEGEWKKLDGTCLEKDTGECVQKFPFDTLSNIVLLGF